MQQDDGMSRRKHVIRYQIYTDHESFWGEEEPPSVSDVNTRISAALSSFQHSGQNYHHGSSTHDDRSLLSAWAVDGLALEAVISRSARAQAQSLAYHIVAAALLATFVPGIAASLTVFTVDVVIVASLSSVGSGSDLLVVGGFRASKSVVVVG